MRKLLVVLIGVVALVSSVYAQADVDVQALARYFPEDTLVYASIRSDEAYFETLDGLLAQVATTLNEVGVAMPPLSVGNLLAGITNTGGSFEETLRPWLGDSIALGVLGVEGIMSSGDTPLIIAFDLSNRDAAVAFLEAEALRSGNVTRTEADDLLIFADDDPQPDQFMVVTDDALLALLSTPLEILPTEQSLQDNETFIETIGQLPESSYNALLYADVPGLLDAGLASADTQPNPQDMQAINLMFDLVGAHAIGLTMLDQGTLVADVVGLPGEMMLPGSSTPIAPAFAAYIPANASLVIQGADLRAVYESAVESLRQFAVANGQPTEEFDQLLGQISFAGRGLTGLEFEELLEGFAGNYAAFVTYTPTEPGQPSLLGIAFYPNEGVPLNIGAGLVLDAGQPETAQALAEAVVGGFEMDPLAGTTLSDETISGTEVSVLSFEVPPTITSSLDLVIGAIGNVVVIATRAEAEAILSGEAGLDTSSTYANALGLALPDTTFFAYTDTNGVHLFSDVYVSLVASQPLIAQIFDNIVTSLNDPSATPDPGRMDRLIKELRPQFTALQAASSRLSGLFQHGVISGAATEEGGYRLRLTLTLN
jgi:hypothetical protein